MGLATASLTGPPNQDPKPESGFNPGTLLRTLDLQEGVHVVQEALACHRQDRPDRQVLELSPPRQLLRAKVHRVGAVSGGSRDMLSEPKLFWSSGAARASFRQNHAAVPPSGLENLPFPTCSRLGSPARTQFSCMKRMLWAEHFCPL
jgi:hypothetical protein